MESVSSSGTEEESIKEDKEEETGFMKSKVQAREYDDEDNFDDLLADIPQSESPITVPAEEPVETVAQVKEEDEEDDEEEMLQKLELRLLPNQYFCPQ